MIRFCVVLQGRGGASDYWAEYVTTYNRGEACSFVERETARQGLAGDIVYVGVVPDSDTLPIREPITE